MPTVLFGRPDWGDLAMQYAVHWLSVGVGEARRRGFDVIDLYGAEATKEKIFSAINTYHPDVAILGGHGNPNTFTSQNLEVTLKACENDEIMTGTISHFLSCSVGQILLPSIIEKKGVWTIGYNVDFQFMVDTKYAVEEDPFAEPFKDVTVTIIKKILDGAKLKEVWDAGIAKCDVWIARLWDRPEIVWAEVISCLQHDRNGMIGLGDKEAYVMPPRVAVAGFPLIPLAVGLGLIGLVLMKPKQF